MQRRDRGTFQSLSGPLMRTVKESRVLLVGAGGIGCELLKNLVMSGFGTGIRPQAGQDDAADETQERKHGIVLIDLDTIDLSNLNRQFLFRKQHIKKPKALIAKETAHQFNPATVIDAHHASIFDVRYTVGFFEGFDIVFNALDNVAARRHVNKMCLAANVPLIESGTTGFNGQVQAIRKGVTECYDCNEKPVQKSYPICTIRSTPSQLIHCIVWAKSYLFPELFGASEDEASDMEVTDGDDAEEVAKLKKEAETLKRIRSLIDNEKFAREVFNTVFCDDIERLKSMKDMWKSRNAPDSLRFERLAIDPQDTIQQGRALASLDQQPWGLLDNFKVFCHSIDKLKARVQGGEGTIEFDKDDKDTLDFVASAANLRAHIFGIPLSTEWEIKRMAGNIIPAIATANALTASLCVMESFKILRSLQTTVPVQAKPSRGKDTGVLGGSKMVFLHSKSTERMILSDSLQAPRSDCPVCSPVYAKLVLPQEGAPTIKQLVELVKARLHLSDMAITTEAGMIYDPDLDDNLLKPLSDFGIAPNSNTFVTVSDESDEPRVDLILSVTTTTSNEDTNLQLLPAELDLPLKPKREPSPADALPVTLGSPGIGEKRKLRDSGDFDNVNKKSKINGNNDVHEIQDDGPILLED